MTIFCCESVVCEATFEHPDVHECEHIEGAVAVGCALLVRAGWRSVWLRVALEHSSGFMSKNQHIFSRGGWICPACVTRYT